MRSLRFILQKLRLLTIGIWNFLPRSLRGWEKRKKSSQSEAIEDLALEDSIFIESLRRENEFLRGLLREEREDRRRLQEILFERLGVIAKSENEQIEVEAMKPIQRFNTLSSIRKRAEEEARKAAGVIGKNEMTDAERIFQENLDKVNKKVERA